MKMKNIVKFLSVGLLVAACNSGEYPERPVFEDPNAVEMLEKVDGRVALGYVTYYGKKIPETKYITHVNYAFAELYMEGDTYVKFGLQGDRARFDQVKKAIRRDGSAKLLLSFTNDVENADNKKGGGFSALAKSPEMRKKFAKDCRDFVRKEGIAGIDIDWEFPGLTFGSNVIDTKHDVDNFTLLMKDLREVLGNEILLTYAGYCMNVQPTSDGGRKYMDAAAVAPYVDFINIMTYDMAIAPRHQAAISDPQAYWDCKRSVEQYINAGVPAEKLVLGVPFYGRKDYAAGGALQYHQIVKMEEADGFKIDNWNDTWQAPYITLHGEVYCGYDDARSIAAKGEFMRQYNLKGMMFWDYEGDDAKGTLRNAVWNAVMQK